MTVAYDSLTGLSKKFALKIDQNSKSIHEDIADNEILLITRTEGFGNIPESTVLFIEKHKHNIIGVCVSGNRNWGEHYGAAGDKIQEQYKIPLVIKFEASGLKKDVEAVSLFLENRPRQSTTFFEAFYDNGSNF